MSHLIFPLQTGYFTYNVDLIPLYTTGEFSFSFFNSGLSPANRISISGVSGKLFDQDTNFIHSYSPSERLGISGNVFTGHQNIFINQVPKNLNCTRLTGYVSGFLINTGNFESASLNIRS